MKIGQYLIQKLTDEGLKHVFGIQGDYVLNFYSQLYHSRLELINTCDEQGAGFAADAYARVRGLGVVCVTYGVGGLKLANTTAQAFAELSPVLVISGAPGISERRHNPLLHHKVRSFETQLNVFREMTVAQTVLSDPGVAAREIDRVISAIKSAKRPGYIELPRDMVDIELADLKMVFSKEPPEEDNAALDEALAEVVDMLGSAKNPVLIAGVEVHRFKLQSLFLKLLQCSGIPFVTGVLSKSVVSELHPQFIGVYAGGMSPDPVREAVENADCVIALGPYVTDLATGIFTHHIDIGRSIVVMPDRIAVKHHEYQNINMSRFLERLIHAIKAPVVMKRQIEHRAIQPFVPVPDKGITMSRLISCLNCFLEDNTTVIAEPGDPLFGSLDMQVHAMAEFLSPAYYASLGFAVPAAIGVQLATPHRRPLALVGDGSFQMTGMELSVAARYGLSPIVVVLNNGGYATFRSMIDGSFNDIPPWKYADIAHIIGKGKGYRVSTEEELSEAMLSAKENSASPSIIEVCLEKHDFSDRLRLLTKALKNRIK